VTRLALLFAALALVACAKAAPAHQITLQCLSAAHLNDERVISAGAVNRGDVAFRPEERVGGRGRVSAFSIDTHEVTNAQFAAFAVATHYVSVAERNGPDGQRTGAAVFDPQQQRWRIDRSADWRHPSGANSSISGRDYFPVVQVAYEDGVAYAHWRGRRLPTENEWERAARGDAPVSADVHAEAFDASGRPLANTWQGVFPIVDRGTDGFQGVAPVGCFPPDANRLYDMVGNVWEWTSDWYSEDKAPASEAYARDHDPQHIAEHVIKGGSFLCADNYCARFRSGSREPGDPGEGMSHLGFRTVRDVR
jgi:formylglycine-generating enzyme required for sulfatase activity